MIQSWIRDQLSDALPSMDWTVDYESQSDHAATVFYEGGGDPSTYDIAYRYPRYMVWISSVDFEEAEYIAQAVFDLLHTVRNVPLTIHFYQKGEVVKTKNVILKKLIAATSPNRIGVEEDKMLYSVNFDATIIDQKEETTNE